MISRSNFFPQSGWGQFTRFLPYILSVPIPYKYSCSIVPRKNSSTVQRRSNSALAASALHQHRYRQKGKSQKSHDLYIGISVCPHRERHSEHEGRLRSSKSWFRVCDRRIQRLWKDLQETKTLRLTSPGTNPTGFLTYLVRGVGFQHQFTSKFPPSTCLHRLR